MDTQKIETAVQMIIEAVGEDINREGLQETPARVARMYQEIFSGLGQTAEEHLSKSFEIIDDNMVVEKDIFFHTMCEHHFLPFYGKAHIAYIPDESLLDGHNAHQAMIHLDLDEQGLPTDRPLNVRDELTGREFQWGWVESTKRVIPCSPRAAAQSLTACVGSGSP